MASSDTIALADGSSIDLFSWVLEDGAEPVKLPKDKPATTGDNALSREACLTWKIFRDLWEVAFEHQQAAEIIMKTQTIVRFWQCKTTFTGGVVSTILPKLDDHVASKRIAVAINLFAGEKSNKPCTTCSHDRSRGPFATCIVDNENLKSGACTNCYYSGSGKKCSLRKAKEAKEAAEALQRELAAKHAKKSEGALERELARMKEEEIERRGELVRVQAEIARLEQEVKNKKARAWSEFIDRGGDGPVPDW